MGTTPVLVRPVTQVNTTDAAVGVGGLPYQFQNGVAGLPDGGYLVVWADLSRAVNTSGSAVMGQRYDARGERVGGEFLVTESFGTLDFGRGDQILPAVAVVPGLGPVVAFVDRRDGDYDVHVRFFGSANLTGGGYDGIETSGNQTIPVAVTGLPNGNYVAAYAVGVTPDIDIAARIVSLSGPFVPTFDIHDEADTSDSPRLATLSNGNFVTVYQNQFQEADYDVWFAIHTPTGTPVVVYNLVPGGGNNVDETTPEIAALRGGGFVVVWREQSPDVSEVRASILTNTGADVRVDFLVNSTQASQTGAPSVVALADGGFLLTWNDADSDVINAQRFDAVGNPIGDEFTVHDRAISVVHDVARLADGRIVYTFDDPSGDDLDVLTSIWNPRGTVATVGDVLWRQADGTVATADGELALASSGWEIQGTGDFDADGDSDILWGQGSAVVTWELENGQLVRTRSLPSASAGWTIGDIGDFDADGDDDLLWYQQGAVVTWEMENGAYVTNHHIASGSNGWTIRGLGDFDADGDDDFLWQHSGGAVVTWEMENGALVTSHSLETGSGGWAIRGTGDFDGDGDDDILWRHTGGAVVTWEMENGGFVTSRSTASAGGGWEIAGTPDFNADGTDDILWRNTSGQVVTWEMQNSALVRTHNFGVTGNDWHIRGTGEFDMV